MTAVTREEWHDWAGRVRALFLGPAVVALAARIAFDPRAITILRGEIGDNDRWGVKVVLDGESYEYWLGPLWNDDANAAFMAEPWRDWVSGIRAAFLGPVIIALREKGVAFDPRMIAIRNVWIRSDDTWRADVTIDADERDHRIVGSHSLTARRA